MVRINLVDPSELTDQHLIAEHNEILMLCGCLRRALNSKRGVTGIPSEFTLGKGHIKFFFDKGLYLHKRFEDIQEEMKIRDFNPKKAFPRELWPDHLYNDWQPSFVDCYIVQDRIEQRIAQKPGWYKFYHRTLEELNGGK